jgi:LmbE family N-acetylglucosaminyl deacetylase
MPNDQTTPASKPSIVFVTAHPDDVAFFMGGTAALLKERYKLHVICATRGERGYEWKGPGPTPPNEEVASMREKEEHIACDMLDASLTFLGLSDGEIYAEQEVVERVAEMLRKIRPVALFTHGPQSKPDHAAVYMIALQALHLADLFWHVEMYMPIQGGETYHGRYADLYVNISSVIEQKRALIACHHSHHKHADSVDKLIAPSAMLGKLAWCDYAEAFMTGLPLMARRWNRKAGSILMELEQ